MSLKNLAAQRWSCVLIHKAQYDGLPPAPFVAPGLQPRTVVHLDECHDLALDLHLEPQQVSHFVMPGAVAMPFF